MCELLVRIESNLKAVKTYFKMEGNCGGKNVVFYLIQFIS